MGKLRPREEEQDHSRKSPVRDKGPCWSQATVVGDGALVALEGEGRLISSDS
jgi:hypothetical protein